MTTLYHYTCDHGARSIETDDMIRPQPQPLFGGMLMTWWTDTTDLAPDQLGLQSTIIKCDRTEAIYIADAEQIGAVRWTDFRRGLVSKYATAISHLELGRAPTHWWITTKDLPL